MSPGQRERGRRERGGLAAAAGPEYDDVAGGWQVHHQWILTLEVREVHQPDYRMTGAEDDRGHVVEREDLGQWGQPGRRDGAQPQRRGRRGGRGGERREIVVLVGVEEL